MTTSTHAEEILGLIRAVGAEPTDAGLRLILADALDETGDPEDARRAEWLRCDVRIADGAFIDPFDLNRRHRLPRPGGVDELSAARAAVREREQRKRFWAALAGS
jgi:uncharacterized protein (TIGR02996 family)